jgi:IrrE N-terminal-like domain
MSSTLGKDHLFAALRAEGTCHGLLLHPPSPALDRRGCRVWNTDLEDEANSLAGALLIPAKAAWWIAKRQLPLVSAAKEYGVQRGSSVA